MPAVNLHQQHTKWRPPRYRELPALGDLQACQGVDIAALEWKYYSLIPRNDQGWSMANDTALEAPPIGRWPISVRTVALLTPLASGAWLGLEAFGVAAPWALLDVGCGVLLCIIPGLLRWWYVRSAALPGSGRFARAVEDVVDLLQDPAVTWPSDPGAMAKPSRPRRPER